MDRMIIYPGAIPLDTDLLNVQRGVMKGLGFLAQACLGSGPVIDGFACAPTVPASLAVTVGPGSITVLAEVDPNPYGSLAADTANLVKMGIVETGTSFTLTAPTVSGQSVNYLIEAAFLEEDSVPVVLPYYNAANPSQAFAGAANSGSSQNTQRLQTVALELKAGAASNTGTQATPSVDPGYVAVAVVTVSAGQTAINANNIAVPASAPFLGFKLPQLQFGSSIARSGWQRLPTGLLVQWGTSVTNTGNLDAVSFPLPFPSAVLSVTATEANAASWSVAGTGAVAPVIYGVANASASGFQLSSVVVRSQSGTVAASFEASASFYWLAVGY